MVTERMQTPQNGIQGQDRSLVSGSGTVALPAASVPHFFDNERKGSVGSIVQAELLPLNPIIHLESSELSLWDDNSETKPTIML